MDIEFYDATSSNQAKLIERDFPYVVEIAVTKHGLEKTLDAIHGFHKRFGVKPRPGHRWEGNENYHIRWCFGVPTIADFFKMEFGRRLAY